MLKTLQNIVISFVAVVVIITPLAWTIDEIATFASYDDTEVEAYAE